MPGRVEKDPEVVGSRLHGSLAGTHLQHGGLRPIEILDIDVDVGLLGDVTLGPRHRAMVLDLLEGELPRRGVQLPPASLRVLVQFTADDRPVELGERPRVGAVDGSEVETADRLNHGVDATARSRPAAVVRQGGASLERFATGHEGRTAERIRGTDMAESIDTAEADVVCDSFQVFNNCDLDAVVARVTDGRISELRDYHGAAAD